MRDKFHSLKNEFSKALADLKEVVDLEQLRTDFMGRKGHLAALMKELGALAQEEKQELGRVANEAKAAMEEAFEKRRVEFDGARVQAQAEAEWLDLTEPGNWPSEGHLHPVSQAIAEITDIFAAIGFSRVRAPEVDWDWYAFESLNMPKDHPARDDWETFFVDAPAGEKGRLVLTPHTSNSQVRQMERQKPPIRMFNVNRCYRRQSDVTHSPMFHQFEGLVIDRGLAVTHLKGVLTFFAHQYFGPQRRIRLRPHHFRFTEPSFEVDISCGLCAGTGTISGAVCRVCKSGWLELGGAGMTHPNVLKAGGVDPQEYQGFAFGWGVERVAMMRQGTRLDDVRLLYRNDLRFVSQF